MLQNEKIKCEFNDIKNNFFVGEMEVDLTNKVQSVYTDIRGESCYDENWVIAM